MGEGASAGTPSPAAMTTNATPGPVDGLTPDQSDSPTPAPLSADRAFEATMSPTTATRTIDETPSPDDRTIDPTDGAVRAGNGVAMGMGVTLAVGVLVAGMVRSL